MHEPTPDSSSSPWSSPGYQPPASPGPNEGQPGTHTPPAQEPQPEQGYAGYGQDGYGHQGPGNYGQTPSSYGVPPSGPQQGMYTFPTLHKPPFDPLAAVSVVTSPISPVGLGFGIASLRRTKSGARSGYGTAVTGVVLSSIFLIAALLAVGTFALDGTFARMSETPVAGDVDQARTASPVHLDVGNCVANLPVGAEVGEVDLVPCAEEHQLQVLDRVTIDSSDYPGAAGLFDLAEPTCVEALEELPDTDSLTTHFLVPSEENWADDQKIIICLAQSTSGPMTGDLLE